MTQRNEGDAMSDNQNPQPWPQQPPGNQSTPSGSFPQWGDEAGPAAGQSAPPYGQPSYGQPGQPAPPYGQPAHPYGQTPGYQNPTYQPAPYGTSPYPGVPAQQPGPAWGGLGLVAMICAGLATLMGVVLAWIAGSNFADAFAALPPGTLESGEFDPATLDPVVESRLTAAGVALMGMFVPTAIGFVALIMGAVAIAKQKGRAAGVVAVLLAIAAPILAFFVLVSLLGGQIANVPR